MRRHRSPVRTRRRRRRRSHRRRTRGRSHPPGQSGPTGDVDPDGGRAGNNGAVDERGWAAPDTPPTVDVGFGGGSPAIEPIAEGPGGPSRTPPRLPVPLRPMTLTDLLDGAFAVIKARPRTVFGIAAAILIPAHVVAAFLQRRATATFSVTNTFNMFNVGGRSNIDGSDIVGVYAAAAL